MDKFQVLYQLVQQLPEQDGEINAQLKGAIARNPSRNLMATMNFPPKVGGTFLRTALTILLKKNYTATFKRGSYASTNQARDLYFPSLLHFHFASAQKPFAVITHNHMIATRPVTALCELFNIRLVINTRNIFDTLVSLYNHQQKLEAEGKYIDDELFLQSDQDYSAMTEEERRWNLINVGAVWYSRFYASWIKYDNDSKNTEKQPILWSRYAELVEEPRELLRKIVTHVDPTHEYSDEEIQAALDESMKHKASLRFNKGITGRGDAFFSDDEKEQIRTIMARRDEHRKVLEKLEIL